MDITIPPKLRVKALEEVTTYLNALWRSVADEDVSDSILKPAAEAWLKDLIQQMMPSQYELVPDFTAEQNDRFRTFLINLWMKDWKQAYIHLGHSRGLTEETAKEVFIHLLQDT
jgi:hypothetical protein